MSSCDTNFKDLASRYEAWYQTPLGALAHTLEQDAVMTLAEGKPGERAVDIGCGTGVYTLELCRRNVDVIGMDPSMEMILIAKEKLRRAGLTGHLVCGSVEALPFRSESFNLALAVTSLCFVHFPGRAVWEIHRVLRPQSRFVLGELNRFSLWALFRRLKGLFADTIYNRAHFWSKEEIKQLLQQNGFRLQTVQTLLYFPPVNLQSFLKGYRFFETVVKRILPGTGAFLVMKAERR